MAGRRSSHWTPFPAPRLRLGQGVAASLVLHLAVLALLLWRPHAAAIEPVRARSNPIQIPLYLEPPPPPVEVPYVPPAPAPPAAELPPAVPLTEGSDRTPGNQARVTPAPEPEPNAQPDAPRVQGSSSAPGAGAEAEGGTDGAADAAEGDAAGREAKREQPAGTTLPALESEAQRLFGRPRPRRPLGVAGTRDVRPWETTAPADSRGCTVPDDALRDSTVPAGMAVVAGKIYREDTGDPLPGARLQILGTPYGAFSNDRGEYRLVFDRTLVNRCRTQLVRVSARGYQARDVVLLLGEVPSSDVPLRRF